MSTVIEHHTTMQLTTCVRKKIVYNILVVYVEILVFLTDNKRLVVKDIHLIDWNYYKFRSTII